MERCKFLQRVWVDPSRRMHFGAHSYSVCYFMKCLKHSTICAKLYRPSSLTLFRLTAWHSVKKLQGRENGLNSVSLQKLRQNCPSLPYWFRCPRAAYNGKLNVVSVRLASTNLRSGSERLGGSYKLLISLVHTSKV